MTDLIWIITSSVLILAVIAIRAIFGKKLSAGVRYALWALVLLRLLIPGTILSSPVSVQGAAEKAEPVRDMQLLRGVDAIALTESGSIQGVSSRPAAQPPTISTPTENAPAENLPSGEEDHTAPKPAGSGSANDPAPAPAVSTLVTEATPERFVRMQTALKLRDILNYVWLIGAGLFALFFIVTNVRFYLRLRSRRVRLDVPCRRPVYSVENLDSSCLFFGTIYISADTARDEKRLRCVLEHELAHFRHGDHIWTLLRSAALILHWYNPLVWLGALLSRRDSELFADAGAVSRLGEAERENYGMTLIELSALRPITAPILCAATTMTNGKRELKSRIVSISKKRKTSVIVLAAVLLIAALAVACTTLGGPKIDEGETPDPAVTAEPAPTAEPTAEPAATAEPTAAPTMPPQDVLLGTAYASLSRVAEMYGLELDRNNYSLSAYDDEGGLPAAYICFYETDNRGARVGGNVRCFADGFRVDFNSIRFTPAWNWEEPDERLTEAAEAEFAAMRSAIIVTPDDIAAAGCTEFNGHEYYDTVGACYAAKLAELYKNAPEGYHSRCAEADAVTVVPGVWLSGAYTVSLALRPEDIFAFTAARNAAYLVNDGRRSGTLFGRIVISDVVELAELPDGSWTSVDNPEVLAFIDEAFEVAAPAAAIHGVTLDKSSAKVPIYEMFMGDLEVTFSSDDKAFVMFCDFRRDDTGALRTSVGQCALWPNEGVPIDMPDPEACTRMLNEVSAGGSMTVTREQLQAAGYALTGGENDLLAAAQYFGDRRAALFTSCSEDNVLRCRACAAVNPRRVEDFGKNREEFIACLAFLPEHPREFAQMHMDCLAELCEPAGHPEYNGWFGYTLNISILENADGSFNCTFGVNAA